MVAKTRKKIEEFYKNYPGYLKKSSKDGLFLILSRHPNLKIVLSDVEEVRKLLSKIKYSDYKERGILNKNLPKTANNSGFKRLYWDLETSYNVVSTWNIGYKINVSHDNIIKERAIICVAFKWADEDKVHTIQWDKGNDKKLIEKFIKILNQADENVTHNGLRFDLPWLRSRALYHGIDMWPEYSSLDTLRLSRSSFKFNSNRLDYLSKFMGFGGKINTGGFKLWQDIVERNDPKAMKKMLEYCSNDVLILEKVYKKLNNYTKAKTHAGVVLGNDKCSCPNCGSEERRVCGGNRVLASGTIRRCFRCKKCNKFYQIPLTVWNTYNKLNMKK